MTTTQGPFTSPDFDLENLVDQWIADRKLSADAIEWLRGEFNELTGMGIIESPSIAPANVCTELDLERGSTWLEVLASLLDASFADDSASHLREIRQYLA